MNLKDAANITRPMSHEDKSDVGAMAEEARLPDVDYLFLIDSLKYAYPHYGDPIEEAYHNGTDEELGRAFREQIEAYREEVRETRDD